MTLRDLVFTAGSNLGRRKLRFFLAALGVLVGTATIVLLVSLASGVRAQINRQFESIGLNRLTVLPRGRFSFGPMAFAPHATNGSARPVLTPEMIQKLKERPGVAGVVPQLNLPRSVNVELRWMDKSEPVRVGESRYQMGFGSLANVGESLAGTLELTNGGSIALSDGAALALGIATNELAGLVGKSIDAELRTSRGEAHVFPLRIRGVYLESASTIRVSPDDVLAMKSWWFNTNNLLQSEGYDSADIRAADVLRARDLGRELQKEGFQVQSPQMFMEIANRIVLSISLLLGLIAGVALVVASIGITNTMVMAIYERTREIGILKSLGASNRDIRRLFLVEAGFIGLAGGLMGLLAGWGAGALMNPLIAWYLRYRELPMRGDFFAVSPLLALGVIGFTTILGMLAGLLPAQRAANLDPLAALRHE
ncbi:MAG: ABC transporter permease [Verrucomicrobiota bacterium]